MIDSIEMKITLTEEENNPFTRFARIFFQITKQLVQTIGVIVFSFTAVSHSQMCYRELEKCKVQSLPRQGKGRTGTQIKWQKSEVELQAAMDNTAPVPYLNGKGGNVSASCNKLAKEICNRVKGQDIWNTASHVPRVKSTTADHRSSIFTITKSDI